MTYQRDKQNIRIIRYSQQLLVQVGHIVNFSPPSIDIYMHITICVNVFIKQHFISII